MCYSVDCEGVCEDGHLAAVWMAIEGCSGARSREQTCKGLVLLGILRCLIPVSQCDTCCIIASPRETTQALAESCDARIKELLRRRPPRSGRPPVQPAEEWVKYKKPLDGLLA